MPRRPIAAQTIGELHLRYVVEGVSPCSAVLARLKSDPRKGVGQICAVIGRREAARRRRRRRCDHLLELERSLRAEGFRRIAGVDEAGVGPLAGPVVAAAVMFPPEVRIPGVDDSKCLDEEMRRDLEIKIRRQASGIGFGIAEVEEINRINVYQASLQALRRAVGSLALKPDYLLVDARTIPRTAIPQRPVVKGDRRHFSIAAASILAKTERDRLMLELDRLHPGYGLAAHKGYATPQHQAAIRLLGASPIHRTSYACFDELTGESSDSFYRLRDGLARVSTRGALSEWIRQFSEARLHLRVEEIRKLQILSRRKKARYPDATQLKLVEL